MKALLQRVKKAKVEIEGIKNGEIGQGLCIFLGIADGDTRKECEYIAQKIAGLRIFEDAHGKMNLSVTDVGSEVLVISQFTLLANCQKGKRPSFVEAAPAEIANELYEYTMELLSQAGLNVSHGEFGEDMQVYIQNDGPVTILLEKEHEQNEGGQNGEQ